MSDEEYTSPSVYKRLAADYLKASPSAGWRDTLLMKHYQQYPPMIRARFAADAQDWCHAWELPITDGKVRLYKAVDAQSLTTGGEYGKVTAWRVGAQVTCTDWNPAPVCGGGLHLCPTIDMAFSYKSLGMVRFLQVEVLFEDIVPIANVIHLGHEQTAFGDRPAFTRNQVDKCKVRTCKVLTFVDGRGQPIIVEPTSFSDLA